MKMNLAILAAAVLAVSACTPVPAGQKNGTITRIQQKGSWHPTWEGEIVRGGSFTGGTGVQGAAFDFTVTDPKLLKQVQDAFENQQEVRIKYHQSWPAWWSSDSEGNFLDGIEVIAENQGGTVTEQRGAAQPAPAAPVVNTGNTDARFNQLMEQNQAILKQNQQLLETLAKK